jgi:hypothetical protein
MKPRPEFQFRNHILRSEACPPRFPVRPFHSKPIRRQYEANTAPLRRQYEAITKRLGVNPPDPPGAKLIVDLVPPKSRQTRIRRTQGGRKEVAGSTAGTGPTAQPVCPSQGCSKAVRRHSEGSPNQCLSGSLPAHLEFDRLGPHPTSHCSPNIPTESVFSACSVGSIFRFSIRTKPPRREDAKIGAAESFERVASGLRVFASLRLRS